MSTMTRIMQSNIEYIIRWDGVGEAERFNQKVIQIPIYLPKLQIDALGNEYHLC